MLFSLFLTFLNIGAFAFGGGYAVLHLLEENLVKHHGWIAQSEFLDILSISQTIPGSIGINAATFSGAKVAGFWGALVATVAVIAVSVVVMITLAYFFYKYQEMKPVKRVLWAVRPIAVAMIIAAGVSIFRETFFIEGTPFSWGQLALFFLCLLALQLPGTGIFKKIKKPSPMILMLVCGTIGVIVSAVMG